MIYAFNPAENGILNTPISLFKNATSADNPETIVTGDMLSRIKNGYYNEAIASVRRILNVEGKTAYSTAKKKLPAATYGGTFHYRNNNGIENASGIATLEVDNIGDRLLAVRDALTQERCLAAYFTSPSGNGLKIFYHIPILEDDAQYKQYWLPLARHIEETFQVNVDHSGKDLARLCFISHDPDLFMRDDAEVFTDCDPEPAKLPRPTHIDAIPTNDLEREVERVIKTAQRMLYDSVNGNRHDTRIKVGELLGGYIASRFMSEDEAISRIEQAIYDNTNTPQKALKDIRKAITHGMEKPVYIEDIKAQRESYRQNGRAMGDTQALDATIHGDEKPKQPGNDALPWSDYTNAVELVRGHGNDLLYCYLWKKWLVWDRTHWEIDTSGAIMRLAKQTVKHLARKIEDIDDELRIGTFMKHIKKSLSAGSLQAMITLAQSEEGIPVQPAKLDSDPWLLNCSNGTLDLERGKLRPHNRDNLITRCISTSYDSQAKCPEWDAFLSRAMGENENLIQFLQRSIGYALTGVIREHVLLILWGGGRNGKSTFLNILRFLLETYAMKAPSELLMVSNSDRHPTERADLVGKRLVCAIETEEGRRLAEVFVKEATGGDPIRARRMREDFWEFQPTHKVFLATNHKPVIKGTDGAIWERIRLVPFNVTIPENERDTSLPEKLQKELPGILAWAVRGCLDWQKNGLSVPDEVRVATNRYRDEMDVLGQFIEECCVMDGSTYRVLASQLYKAYEIWCGGDNPMSQKAFGTAMTERGCERGRARTGAAQYIGIGLSDRIGPHDEPSHSDHSSI